MIAFLYPHSLQGRGSLLPVGNHRIQTGGGDHNIGRGCHHISASTRQQSEWGPSSWIGSARGRHYAYLDRRLKLQQDGLRDEYFTGFCAQITDLCFQELHLFAWAATSDFQQSVDYGIEVYIILIRHFFCPQGGRR